MSDRSASSSGPSERLAQLHEQADTCRRCPLGEHATRALGGVGRVGARLMLVLEGPSHEADLSGEPLAGPSGRILAEALVLAGLDASDVYLTHAAKHFAWRARGARRLPRRPTTAELLACRQFLQSEATLVSPQVIVALGISAARSLLERPITLRDARTHVFPSDLGPTLVTHQPAAIARLAKGLRARAFAELMHDLSAARALALKLSGASVQSELQR